MATPVQENLITSNKSYAANFDKGHLPLPPGKRYTVVTCMDARIDPAAAFGIDLGDAHVIRNAGASAKDALRSIVISQQLLQTQEVLLVKHTGCGMLTFQNSDATSIVEKNLGPEAVTAVKDQFGGDFLPFKNLEEQVKEDVAWLKENKAIGSNVTVSGWVYDVTTGKVKNV
ncbi:beta-carbonic anhydrase, cab [Glarea lozoyensis ATCC 20868]|uniref:Carbonic anhydrase n=1 Tax=Glarea lozoyensis (strain ATCC 20868 / MF5171) TaxID=1116229 RepID=S3ECM9_GLAL2|nr:beta-carbonic anhydrase, cab [Glarea lozoyensis ATCC 20868]EPE36063.1 beta-carbonic anhydrase, cab [Glarea lozoyensis ATCC 20868]